MLKWMILKLAMLETILLAVVRFDVFTIFGNIRKLVQKGLKKYYDGMAVEIEKRPSLVVAPN